MALLKKGPMSKVEIAATLKMDEDVAKSTLGRLKKNGQVGHRLGADKKVMWFITSKPPAVSS